MAGAGCGADLLLLQPRSSAARGHPLPALRWITFPGQAWLPGPLLPRYLDCAGTSISSERILSVCRRRCAACLCKALSDSLMQNMPAPSCDSKQREGKHCIFIFPCCSELDFFFLTFFFFFLLSLCLRQVFECSVLPKLFPRLSPAIRQSDSSETLQVNKFKC